MSQDSFAEAITGVVAGGGLLAVVLYVLSHTAQSTYVSPALAGGASGFRSGLMISLSLAVILVGATGYILSSLSSPR